MSKKNRPKWTSNEQQIRHCKFCVNCFTSKKESDNMLGIKQLEEK